MVERRPRLNGEPEQARTFPDAASYVGRESQPSNLIFDLSEGTSSLELAADIREISQRVTASDEYYERLKNYGEWPKEPLPRELWTPAQKHLDSMLGMNHVDKDGKTLAGNLPQIFLSGGGSDEILERIFLIYLNRNTKIVATGPHFPETVRYIYRIGYGDVYGERLARQHIKLEPEPFLGQDGAIKKIKDHLDSDRRRNELIYLCNPGTPSGDTASLEELREIAELFKPRGHILLIDEAFMDPRNSAAVLAKEFDNMMIIGSGSKRGLRTPAARVGWIVTSENLAAGYYKSMRNFSMPLFTQMFADLALDPQRIIPELEREEREVRPVKEALIESLPLEMYDETDVSVPIMTVVGSSEGYDKRLEERGVKVTSGQDFHDSNSKMDSRRARIKMVRTVEEARQLAEILIAAA